MPKRVIHTFVSLACPLAQPISLKVNLVGSIQVIFELVPTAFDATSALWASCNHAKSSRSPLGEPGQTILPALSQVIPTALSKSGVITWKAP
eukprot:scaffold513_cov169-Amphora_coffeaeformis.AAC.9